GGLDMPDPDMSRTAMPDTDMPDTDISQGDMTGSDDSVHGGELTIDCASCLARPAACGDCIVTVLLGPPGAIGGEEQAAFAVLAGSGLVPPLRLVTGHEGVA
ncbi:MAG: hypothetical protein ACO3HV_08255, partial [Candidatus Nanopelagicales bacterium]